MGAASLASGGGGGCPPGHGRGHFKILNFKFSGDADVLLMLSQDSEDEIRSRFVFELAI